MRILAVTSAFLPDSRGGTELHAFQLARELVRLGHELRILTRCGDASRPDYERDEIEVEGLPVTRINYNFGDVRSFRDLYTNPRMDALFAEELDRFAPDLVHIHHLTCLSTSIIDVARDRGLPTVMTLHDFWMVCPRGQRIDPELRICDRIDRVKCHACLARLWPHLFPDAAAGRLVADRAPRQIEDWDAFIQRVLARCNLLITPSEFHLEKMLEFPLPRERMTALPHGLDTRALLQQRDPEAPIRRIGFIGSVIPSKGVHLLTEAFDLLGRPDLELSIWGEAPSFHGDTGYVERMKAGLRPGLQVRFHGAYDQRELAMILRDIDVLVVPSLWWESFCLTIREGLLAGAIVVAADHGPMSEALAMGRDGILFEPGSASDLAAKLRALLDDPALARRHRNKGHVVKDMARNAREMLDLYGGVLRDLGRDPNLALPVAAPRAATTAEEGEVDVTVFIPTYNGGRTFEAVIEAVFAQKTSFRYEVLIIDSGSTDGTLDVLARYPLRLIKIPNYEFNHGLTRNRAVHEARGRIVALLTHDAVPYDDSWLESLVRNFDDPEVAGAYCHQLPRSDCNPFMRDRLEGWTKGEGERQVKQLASRADWESMSAWERYRLIAFDDVASCVRKSVMATIPFERRQFGEDVAWGKQAILAGWKLVMDPNAVVVHSHNNSIWYEFKRVYLDHQNLHDLVGMHLVQRFADVFRFTLAGTRHLGGVIRRARIPLRAKIGWWLKVPFYSLGQNMGQYLGARSGIEKKRGVWGFIDSRLKKGV
ncbi:MAG: glycosyltransferase [Planctomycetes bacterium]|nr:glycosyltransferase [Planctomycetota bacterium]